MAIADVGTYESFLLYAGRLSRSAITSRFCYRTSRGGYSDSFIIVVVATAVPL